MKRRTILVLGCGSIGRRHIGNLKRLGHVPVAFDPDAKRRLWIEKELGCRTVADAEQGLAQRPDAVWVCTPPHLHMAAAKSALKRGIPCFIEKPLAHTVADAAVISKLSRRHKAPVAVGYQLRSHPALRQIKAGVDAGRWGRLLFVRAEVGQYLPDWRPWQDYRKSYTSRKDMGGGILLDASHEIDLVRWLVGEVRSVFCLAGKQSRLEIDVEDTAALIFRHDSGVISEVHLDMVQRTPRRNLQLVFERGTVLWDLPSAELRISLAGSKRPTVRRVKVDLNSLYVSEAKEFLASLSGSGGRGVIGPKDGAMTLAVAAAAQRSIRSGRLERVR